MSGCGRGGDTACEMWGIQGRMLDIFVRTTVFGKALLVIFE
jgi:hypothetical protein